MMHMDSQGRWPSEGIVTAIRTQIIPKVTGAAPVWLHCSPGKWFCLLLTASLCFAPVYQCCQSAFCSEPAYLNLQHLQMCLSPWPRLSSSSWLEVVALFSICVSVTQSAPGFLETVAWTHAAEATSNPGPDISAQLCAMCKSVWF